MFTAARVIQTGFDAEQFEVAFAAADFDRCREIVERAEGTDVVLASARLALRERRYVDVIGSLSQLTGTNAEDRIARDVMLGAALGLTRDYVTGNRLIERALNELSPAYQWYYDALNFKALIAWMRQQYGEAQEGAELQLGSPDPNRRARAHILLSWIAVRRGTILRQVDELQKALDELDTAQLPDQFVKANALQTLALLCRELPLREVGDRVRGAFESLPWTSALQLEHFQVSRYLGAFDELNGNELAAFGRFKQAARLAPSEHWTVQCYLDRALLAKNTGEKAFAAEQLQEAHEIAQRIPWNEVNGEELSALLVLAELFAASDPGIAEQYLARFRTLKASVIPILSMGSDPRIKGFEAYSQGVAWLKLGDVNEGKAALAEAWSIFEDFNYGWRAALCALALYDVTNDRRWVARAAKKIDPWPNSWIARRIVEATSAVRLDHVPPAKRQVLELVRAGRRNTEIARALGRSPNTVRNQLSQLFQTFNVKSRAELVAALSKPVAPVTQLETRRWRLH